MKKFTGAQLHILRKEDPNVLGEVKTIDLGDITEKECKSIHDDISRIESIIGQHKSHIWISEQYTDYNE